ncbi:DUF3265 domain-containing protein [Vibrio alginolyticus]
MRNAWHFLLCVGFSDYGGCSGFSIALLTP